MANHMVEVARMLGVELGEEFEVELDSNILTMTAMLTENGLKVNKTNMIAPYQHSSSCILEWLLCGLVTIKRRPWKPKYGEDYYCIGEYGQVIKNRCDNCWMDTMYYKVGNCYRTKEQAINNVKKWENFYASDEVLEV